MGGGGGRPQFFLCHCNFMHVEKIKSLATVKNESLDLFNVITIINEFIK